MANELVLSVRLGAAEFRRFAVFNTFRRRRAWVRPLLFALIFTGFSLICLLSGREQGGLLGGVLRTEEGKRLAESIRRVMQD